MTRHTAPDEKMSTPCVVFRGIGMFTTPGGVATEGGESSEDGGAQGESGNTRILISGPQKVEQTVDNIV